MAREFDEEGEAFDLLQRDDQDRVKPNTSVKVWFVHEIQLAKSNETIINGRKTSDDLIIPMYVRFIIIMYLICIVHWNRYLHYN